MVKNEMETRERISELITKFTFDKNYFAYLFSFITRVEDETFPSIMGVGVTDFGQLYLGYNPKLVDGTSDEDIGHVINHEGLHLLNQHIPRLIKLVFDTFAGVERMRRMHVFNVAADCCVNAQGKLPDHLMIDGEKWNLHFPKTYKLPENQITEYYYDELLKRKDFECPPIPSHCKWGVLPGGSTASTFSRQIEQNIRNLIAQSLRKFKDRGMLPGYINDLIDDILTPPKLPYTQFIRKMIVGSKIARFKKSPTRINRKRSYVFFTDDGSPVISPFPGRVSDRTFNLSILIDTSGSMSKEEVMEALSAGKSVIENDRDCTINVIQCDTEVKEEYKIRKISDIRMEIKGRGGTTLAPGLKRAKELKTDLTIAFTDGACDNINEVPVKDRPNKILWVMKKGCSAEMVNRTGTVVYFGE